MDFWAIFHFLPVVLCRVLAVACLRLYANYWNLLHFGVFSLLRAKSCREGVSPRSGLYLIYNRCVRAGQDSPGVSRGLTVHLGHTFHAPSIYLPYSRTGKVYGKYMEGIWKVGGLPPAYPQPAFGKTLARKKKVAFNLHLIVNMICINGPKNRGNEPI